MSKLLLVLEEHFVMDTEKNFWSKRVIDDEYLDRYLNIFDEIIIFARINTNTTISAEFKKITRPGVHFIAMPDFHGPKELIKKSFKIISAFRDGLKECDAVILRSPSPISLLLYRFVPKGVPFGAEFMMGADKFFEGENLLHTSLNRIIDKEAQKLVLKANGVSYVTKKELQKKYPCRAVLEGNSDNYFTTNYSSIDLKKDFYNCNAEKELVSPVRLIHVGFMDYFRKGQDIVIEATKLLIEEGYDVQLDLIGDGKARETFETLAKDLKISDKVFFHGNINNKMDIQKKLIDSDVFVFPSHSEGLPRVIIEAMACSLPVIASDVDGIPELVEEKYIVDDFNPKSYMLKIKALIESEDEIQLVRKRNFDFSKQYSAENLSLKRSDFYSKLMRLAILRKDNKIDER